MQSRITQLLEQVRAGDRSALDELIELVYPELRRIAQGHLRKERPGHTLQPTALVHEAFLRLFGGSQPQFSGRAHFLAIVSQVMRRILVDYARARASARRGGRRVPWSTTIEMEAEGIHQQVDLLELNEALEALARERQPLAQAIEMRYFGGMTAQEVAEVAGRSVDVVRHELRIARAWLRRELARRNL